MGRYSICLRGMRCGPLQYMPQRYEVWAATVYVGRYLRGMRCGPLQYMPQRYEVWAATVYASEV